jgi:hypothetical protein
MIRRLFRSARGHDGFKNQPEICGTPCYAPTPLISGTVDHAEKPKLLCIQGLRQSHPVSKRLDSGTVDEFHNHNVRLNL